jgi:hypothetical protein
MVSIIQYCFLVNWIKDRTFIVLSHFLMIHFLFGGKFVGDDHLAMFLI